MKSKFKHYSWKLFLINSNWTSVTSLEGWRHYRIASRRKSSSGELELEMMAVCDREIRLWVKRSALRDEMMWKTGWTD